MKLYDLFHSVPWSMVETAMYDRYDVKTESCLDNHKQVYDKALVMEPVTNSMVLSIKASSEDGYDYFDLTGEDGTRNRDMPDFKYMGIPDNDPRADAKVGFALEFRPWQGWLGMTVSPETLEKFPPEEILAHCLWEMAFISFEEPEIQEKIEELEKTVEDIKAGRAKIGKTYNSAKEMFDDIMSRKGQLPQDQDPGSECE